MRYVKIRLDLYVFIFGRKFLVVIKTYTCEDLMLPCIDVSTDEEAISLLADAAIVAGYADPEFKPAVLKRENSDPSALNMTIPIAVPHVHIGCKKNFVALATLKNPVSFGNMADLTNTLPVRVVFLVGLESLSVQSRVLRTLLNSVQVSNKLTCYLEENNSTTLLKFLCENMAQDITVE